MVTVVTGTLATSGSVNTPMPSSSVTSAGHSDGSQAP